MSDQNHALPVKAVPIAPDWSSETPGVFWIEDDFDIKAYQQRHAIVYVCPCGCEQQISLPLCVGTKIEKAWLWDGNREAPTLSPSIRRLDGCKWHGFLKAGIWEPCGDSGR